MSDKKSPTWVCRDFITIEEYDPKLEGTGPIMPIKLDKRDKGKVYIV